MVKTKEIKKEKKIHHSNKIMIKRGFKRKAALKNINLIWDLLLNNIKYS